MTVTMHDVATRAGVSIKTVSNVLNGYPHVREATRSRVLEAVDALGYQMNVSARSLRTGRTGIISLAVPELSLAYFAELADSVIKAAAARTMTVLIEQTNAVRENEIEVVQGSRRNMTDGLIFSPLALGPEDLSQLPTDRPLVLLGERLFHQNVDHVTMSNVEAARAATEHLLAIGRRRIAVIGAHPEEMVGTARFRLDGYLAALDGAGLGREEALIVPSGPWRRANGAQAMVRLLRSGVSFDGVFCFNDTLALGALRVLLSRGVRVPDDVAIVGFDDIDETRYCTPTLTSISPGREQIARTAVDLLSEQIHRPERRAAADIAVGFELVARESTMGR